MAPDVIDRPDPPSSGGAPDDALQVTARPDAQGVVLLVRGEIDISSVGPLKACLAHVLADSSDPVVVDLAEVTFMDSSGLAVVADAYRRLAGTPRSFGIRNPTPTVERVLSIAGLETLVQLG